MHVRLLYANKVQFSSEKNDLLERVWSEQEIISRALVDILESYNMEDNEEEDTEDIQEVEEYEEDGEKRRRRRPLCFTFRR